MSDEVGGTARQREAMVTLQILGNRVGPKLSVEANTLFTGGFRKRLFCLASSFGAGSRRRDFVRPACTTGVHVYHLTAPHPRDKAASVARTAVREHEVRKPRIPTPNPTESP
jgi:hypothetical protein